MTSDKPLSTLKLAICGPSLSGKDVAADYLKHHTTLRFEGGGSWHARHYMAERLSKDESRLVTPIEAYECRHEDRMKWYNYLNEFRRDDPLKLILLCLEDSDIVVGIRDYLEIKAAREHNVFDLIIWINRPNVPPDPTLTFDQTFCDIIIDNDSTLEVYYHRLHQLAKALRILRNP